jgi:hypothetical protein
VWNDIRFRVNWSSRTCLLSFDRTLAQRHSIGFRSGEFGGRCGHFKQGIHGPSTDRPGGIRPIRLSEKGRFTLRRKRNSSLKIKLRPRRSPLANQRPCLGWPPSISENVSAGETRIAQDGEANQFPRESPRSKNRRPCGRTVRSITASLISGAFRRSADRIDPGTQGQFARSPENCGSILTGQSSRSASPLPSGQRNFRSGNDWTFDMTANRFRCHAEEQTAGIAHL